MLRPHQLVPLAAFVAAQTVASAQTPFTKVAEVTDTLWQWTDITTADMNQDGLSDVIVALEYGTGVKVLRSRGGGFFESSYRTAQAAGQVFGVEDANWNDDGLPDLLLSIAGDAGWELWVATAMPSDQEMIASPLLAGLDPVASMEALDMDGDGDNDVFLRTSGTPGSLTWYERTPVGLSATPNTLISADLVSSSVEDLNGDGIVDVSLVTQASSAPVVLRGLGGGAFSSPLQLFPLSAPGELYAAGDMNGDGAVDFVTVLGSTVRARYSTGSFVYANGVTIGTTALINVRDVRLVDLEGDGDLDVFLGQAPPENAGGATVIENLGAGSFQAVQSAYPPSWPLSEFADATGDGRVDAIGGVSDTIQVRVQTPPGSPTRFFNPANITAPFQNGRVLGVFDIDGDGPADVFGTFGNDMVWFRHYGDMTFSRRETILTFPSFTEVVYGAELTGDSLTDVVTIELVGGFREVLVRDNLGGGNFAAPRQVAPPGDYARVFPVDVDGDGDNDMVATPFLTTQVPLLVFLNNGSGGFSSGGSLGVVSSWTRNAIGADFDQDGITDLAVVAGSTIQWARGLTSGTFLPFTTILSGGTPSQLGAQDMDGDGFLDIHAYISGKPQWLRQSSPGSFDSAVNMLPANGGNAPPVVLIEDFDLDGLPDVAAGAGNSPIVPIFGKSLGGGNFAPASPLAENELGLQNFIMSDADQDGDIDIFYRSFFPARVGVLVNESVPSPGRTVCGPAATNSSGLSASTSAFGAPLASATTLGLRASKLPTNQFGFFVGSRTARTAVAVAGSQGRICLGGSIGRYLGPGQIVSSGPSGSFQVTVSPVSLRDGTGATPAVQGETWYFQAWFRDVTNQGGATSNFTDAVAIEFM